MNLVLVLANVQKISIFRGSINRVTKDSRFKEI
jgi:hypothetical protein